MKRSYSDSVMQGYKRLFFDVGVQADCDGFPVDRGGGDDVAVATGDHKGLATGGWRRVGIDVDDDGHFSVGDIDFHCSSLG